MITTGTKVFSGATFLAAVAAFVYVVSSGGQGELMGFWTLTALTVALAFIGGIVAFFRDADPNAAQLEALSAADAEGRSDVVEIAKSPWSLVSAFGVAVTLFGLVLDRRVFVLGTVIILAAILEWAVQGWADRASGDPAYNAELRNKIARPFEFPIFGGIVGVFVVVGFSRVLLAPGKTASVVVFAGFALSIFVIAIVISMVPRAARAIGTLALVLLGVAVLAAGVAGAAHGERNKAAEKATATATRTVSDKSNIFATISIEGNQMFIDAPDGLLIVAKASTVNILIRNHDNSKHNLVVKGDDGKVVSQTEFIGQDHATILTLRLDKPGVYDYESEGGPTLLHAQIKVL